MSRKSPELLGGCAGNRTPNQWIKSPLSGYTSPAAPTADHTSPAVVNPDYSVIPARPSLWPGGGRRPTPRLAPEPPPVAGARWLPLTHGHFALVDECDYDAARVRAWYCRTTAKSRTVYAIAKFNGKHVSLHRFVWARMGGPETPEIDHINLNGLDCRRSNLRAATRSQNTANVLPRRGRSGFKGVGLKRFGSGRARWRAFIGLGRGKTHVHLGFFDTPEAAARAYDEAAVRYFGEFARTNASLGLLPSVSQ